MNYLQNVNERGMSRIKESGFEEKISGLMTKDSNELELISDIKSTFDEIQRKRDFEKCIQDIINAQLNTLTGQLMNQAKESVEHGKWTAEARKHFPLPEVERNIRMKVARIKDIEKFYFLGWKRISTLAKTFTPLKKKKVLNPFQDIANDIDYTLDYNDPDDFEMFEHLVDAYVIQKTILKKNNIKLKFMTVVDAVESKIKFSSSIIEKLKNSLNPSVTLNNLIWHEIAGRRKDKKKRHNNERKISESKEICRLMRSLVSVGKSLLKSNTVKVAKINMNVIQDCIYTIKEIEEAKKLMISGN